LPNVETNFALPWPFLKSWEIILFLFEGLVLKCGVIYSFVIGCSKLKKLNGMKFLRSHVT
jgi:hypothetical protein